MVGLAKRAQTAMNDINEKTEATPDKPATATRRWKRYRVDLRLKITNQIAGRNTVVFGQGNDVSEGGMSAYIPAEFVVGESVMIELTLPYSKQPILLQALVRSRNGFRYGLEYTEISDADRDQMARSLKAIALVQ